MKTNRLFTLTAAALLSSAIGFAQAGAVDALKNSIMTPTVSAATSAKPFTAKRKPKLHTAHSKSCALACSNGNTPNPTNKPLLAMAKPFGSMT